MESKINSKETSIGKKKKSTKIPQDYLNIKRRHKLSCLDSYLNKNEYENLNNVRTQTSK